jgi:hypothetical protein
MKLFTSKDAAQVKLSKLSRETQGRPALIQVSDELKTEGTG